MSDGKIHNLGTLNGRLLVFGGPYSNLQATEKMLETARELAVPPSNIICTGDLTAYCGDPDATARLIKKAGIHVIKGNCEESLAEDQMDCGCGYDGETECARLSVTWYDLARRETGQDLKTWMADLPDRLTFRYAGKRFHVLHGSVTSISEFIFPSTDTTTKRCNLDGVDADVILCGHSGFPFTQKIDDRVWHNAGVIGLPANDGTQRTWYALIDVDADGIRFSHHPLTYDHTKAAKTMRKKGLNDYAATLESGIYPTFDSIPDAERTATGKPISPETIALAVSRALT